MNSNEKKFDELTIVHIEDSKIVARGLKKVLKESFTTDWPNLLLKFNHVVDKHQFNKIKITNDQQYIIDLNLGGPKGPEEGIEMLKLLLKENSVFDPIVYSASKNEKIKEKCLSLGIREWNFISKGLLNEDFRKIMHSIKNNFLAYQSTKYVEEKPQNEKSNPSLKKLIYPSYSKDDLQGDDHLNFTPDIEALAMLISSKKNTPPMSIGVFADWGSGKSFFMNKLEDQINHLSGFNFSTSEAEIPFVERVLSIRFNAWHYVDTDLWSSIFCHIISSLSQDLYPKDQGHNQLEKLYEELEFFKLRTKGLELEKHSLEEGKINLESRLQKMRNNRVTPDGNTKQKTPEEQKLEDQVEAFKLKIKRISSKIKRIKKGLDLADHLPMLFSKYDKNLGLIATIRKDLQTLNDKFLKDEGFRAKGACIDRIVLFIDDLDRCQPDKVVAVLQAIHLLLAFELFVVVVGVDIRWVSKAISNSYPHLRDGTDLIGVKDANTGATTFDYLEKIFQIPYTLPVLNRKSVKNLLNAVLSDDLLIIEEAPIETSSTDSEERKLIVKQNEETVSSISTEKQLMMTSEKLNIDNEEMEFIYSLSPLLIKSPRTVKRFVNVFRILKVHTKGPKRKEDVRAALLILAIQIGFPSIALSLFRSIEKSKQTSQKLETFLKDESNLGLLKHPRYQEFYDLLASIHLKNELLFINTEELQRYIPLVRSFSFRANH